MGTLLAVIFLIVCILLIIIVLLQKGRGGGLGAAFGGSGSSAFGTKTGDVFTWVTIVLTALFLLLAIGATLVFRPEGGTVDPPRIDPPDKTEIPAGDERFVRLENQTPGAVMYYTLDGSDPSEQSTPWKSAFSVKAGMTVKARAFRGGWTPSKIVSASYVATRAKPGAEEEEIEATTRPATRPAATLPAEAPVATRPAATKPAEPPQPAAEAPKGPATTGPAGTEKK